MPLRHEEVPGIVPRLTKLAAVTPTPAEAVEKRQIRVTLEVLWEAKCLADTGLAAEAKAGEIGHVMVGQCRVDDLVLVFDPAVLDKQSIGEDGNTLDVGSGFITWDVQNGPKGVPVALFL